ncbi:SgcJ/EcaC family oxidoreductase [Maribacter algarum]|uniref:SgcJ/EcaC family oxidoreductase n=1 Tax=Maribacter algarum (ex Zhang et al. 2020) TaxID=2578118 RepID=A0A5S3PQL9_9FLAO|nr:SgcJ/EcaC family oxidoreductase [Maribacter algarum]TMM57040.1 SgcJ/EcaC family oxidoreductase [Maribacter algarum]
MNSFLKANQLISIVAFLCFSVLQAQSEKDKKLIEKIITNQAEGWKNKNLDLTLEDYADNVDWTNAFGDRMRSKEELKALLSDIYSMGFVMKGVSENQYNDINFLSPEIAIVHSKTIVKGQEWCDGTKMEDRHNYHLRVFQKKDSSWKVISHLISQAWTKK